jgi:hypothetical protein
MSQKLYKYLNVVRAGLKLKNILKEMDSKFEGDIISGEEFGDDWDDFYNDVVAYEDNIKMWTTWGSRIFKVGELGYLEFQIECGGTNCCGLSEIGYVGITPYSDKITDAELVSMCKRTSALLNKRFNNGIFIGTDVVEGRGKANKNQGTDSRLFFELAEWDTDGEIVKNTNSGHLKKKVVQK